MNHVVNIFYFTAQLNFNQIVKIEYFSLLFKKWIKIILIIKNNDLITMEKANRVIKNQTELRKFPNDVLFARKRVFSLYSFHFTAAGTAKCYNFSYIKSNRIFF